MLNNDGLILGKRELFYKQMDVIIGKNTPYLLDYETEFGLKYIYNSLGILDGKLEENNILIIGDFNMNHSKNTPTGYINFCNYFNENLNIKLPYGILKENKIISDDLEYPNGEKIDFNNVYSNYKNNSNKKKLLLDYFFYNKMDLQRMYLFPKIDQENSPMPNEEQPSDHLPLYIEVIIN